ncbi:helix-turn-helix domain-containing protein [Facklamia sp. DSM 111018]|uniref:Helix-turn-helix domain-containing protein n=1 Tax=Facklamia lactis TaxID=2749967 RepID=A0ABS0LSN3_9LACT|nr:helix-turn-helix domain-containing protein [Facklamia lactis]MBG9987024.1 helix-turn-helix domain-containing protein [Facklamia lactis]
MKSYWRHFLLDNGEISLIEAGTQKYLPNQINDYTVKHDYVLHLVLSGKGIYKVNNKSYTLSANDCFVLKKNHAVYYAPDEKDPWTICWIGLGGNNINHYLNHTLVLSSDTFHLTDQSKVFNYTIDTVTFLRYVKTSDTSEVALIYSRIYKLISLINEELSAKRISGDPLENTDLTFAEEIYAYIYENFQTGLTIEDIAKYFDISRNYLFKICKHYYNQSPKQIVQELRMNLAAQLLRDSHMKINEISDTIGYKDAFQFSKIFKNYYGHSPSQFRFISDEAIDEALFIRNKFLE